MSTEAENRATRFVQSVTSPEPSLARSGLINMMRRAIGLCEHQWADHRNATTYSGGQAIEHHMVQRCQYCGTFRRLKI